MKRRVFLGVAAGVSAGYLISKHRQTIRNEFRRVRRFSLAAGVTARIALDYYWKMRKLAVLEEEDKYVFMSELHERNAQRLYSAIVRLGGSYTKGGQHIISLYHIVPMEYVEAMLPLLDKNPFIEFSDVKRVIEEDLKKPLDELFEEFDSTPLACGSIAQVHKAKLRTGECVCVKVQLPELRNDAHLDVDVVEALCHVVAAFFPR